MLPPMITFQNDRPSLSGSSGSIIVPPDDEITLKLAMLYEGRCEGSSPSKAAEKFGYSKQRFFQLLHQFEKLGAIGLKSQITGPKSNYRRTEEIVRQVIRLRFLDPDASLEVLVQKLKQTGHSISIRSVERIVADFGLQKKTLQV